MRDFRIKKIGFYTEGLPFDGGTLERQAIGGSETALIQASQALARRGHQVTVFNNCSGPGVYYGVTYLPIQDLPRRVLTERYDVFIISRFFGLLTVSFPARLKVLWNHDTLEQPALLRQVLPKLDLMFVLSDFHRHNFLTRVPEAEEITIVTRNGLDLELIQRATARVRKDPNKMIYASRPERGLQTLLEYIWPQLHSLFPEIRLHVCGYQVAPHLVDQRLSSLYEHIDELMVMTPGIVNLGPLTKMDYYRHLAESMFMLYPCSFPEISCLAVLEAQACGTAVITSDAYALSESVKVDEFKVSAHPDSLQYSHAFTQRAMRLISQPEETAAAAVAAQAMVHEAYSWDKIVGEWDRLFDLALSSVARRSVIRPA